MVEVSARGKGERMDRIVLERIAVERRKRGAEEGGGRGLVGLRLSDCWGCLRVCCLPSSGSVTGVPSRAERSFMVAERRDVESVLDGVVWFLVVLACGGRGNRYAQPLPLQVGNTRRRMGSWDEGRDLKDMGLDSCWSSEKSGC